MNPKGNNLSDEFPKYEDATPVDILLGRYQGERRVMIGAGGLLAPGQIIKYSIPDPITSITDLAPLIRKARKAMRMNQQQFADAAGVGRRFLSELENGKSSLEFDKVLACALAAGIDIVAKPRKPD